MTDPFGGRKSADMLTPFTRSAIITPDDKTPLAILPRAIYVGSSSNITMKLAEDETAVLFTAVPIGVLWVRPKLIMATGTGAGPFVALW